jgi:glycosyltransferase involved in cell wall biosynthesis
LLPNSVSKLLQSVIQTTETAIHLGTNVLRIKTILGELEGANAELASSKAELASSRAELASSRAELASSRAELASSRAELEELKSVNPETNLFYTHYSTNLRPTSDLRPWEHPFLTEENLGRLRDYSEEVWKIALDYCERRPRRLNCAFSVNVAENMYNWGCLAAKHGADATIFPFTWDNLVMSQPEWEEFDGTFEGGVYAGKEFLARNPGIKLRIPCRRIPIEGDDLLKAYHQAFEGDLRSLMSLLHTAPYLKHWTLFNYAPEFYHWANELSRFDVVYTANVPIAAYFSGVPYSAISVGADFQVDCGRGDLYGKIMRLAFNEAKFIMISNPHSFGHSRRLGFVNGIYLPYPIEDSRYCPGEGRTRRIWEEQFGPGIYVLVSSRIDAQVKGYSNSIFEALIEVIRSRPEVKFIFLSWGEDADHFKKMIMSWGLVDRMIVLPTVGKKKLIDYYRSADIILDQFVYGYYGATALEAAAIGKPIIMKLRKEHYDPLYDRDVMPAENAATPEEVREALLGLIDNKELRLRRGTDIRKWLVRNHGEQRTVPLMLALLRLTADHVRLPAHLISPLMKQESEEEKAYHEACLIQEVKQ